MYCWDSVWSVPSALTRSFDQRVCGPGSHAWAPCGLLHHAGCDASARVRLRRLVAYWWHTFELLARRQSEHPVRPRPPWERSEQEVPLNRPACRPGPLQEAFDTLDKSDADDLAWS